ncbi:MAG: LTA synthase family protein [Bacilli bacterium]|nr:LTA synthase family protein [Bacilli bacterium]
MKKRIIKQKDRVIKFLKLVKKEHLIKKYIHNNVLFITFVLTCVFNSTMLRFLTMHLLENYLSIKPILADTAILVIVGSFGYLLKPKNRFSYYLAFNILFSALCMINSIYYTFYTSFASVSMLSLTQYIASVGDAVVENVLQLKDVIYILGPIILIIVHIRLKKKGYYKKIEVKSERKRKTIKTLVAGCIIAVLFTVTLSALDISRFAKQWNREYVVMKFGIYIYQLNDIITSVQPKINSLFGYDKAMKEFKEYYKDIEKQPENEYTNIFKDKNVLVLHAESIQTNLFNLSFNGIDVVPNLKRIASEGMYFSNFYPQVSVGTSSDSELTFTTSLMPTQSGTAFVSYFDRTYNSIPEMMNNKGYYTFSMHANNADFWNRRAMYEHLGYQKFYSKTDYNVTNENTIGLGLSDQEFFKQSMPKLKKINEKYDKWYGLMIMLSNHTPFSDIEHYGEYDVTMKEVITKEDGTTEEIVHPYMEGRKLGNYFKSAHYADQAIGELFQELEENKLLDDTVVVIYGDHDARLSRSDYDYMYNYDKQTESKLDKDHPNYKEYDFYQYELGRKVPFIIWTKDMKDSSMNKEIKDVMGMYDVMPTLGNMFGFYNKYQLGHDIFDIKSNNIVVFPTGNWVTNRVYYNSQKEEYLSLDGSAISEEEITKNSEYTTKLLNLSNDIIVYDLIERYKEEKDILTYKEGS